MFFLQYSFFSLSFLPTAPDRNCLTLWGINILPCLPCKMLPTRCLDALHCAGDLQRSQSAHLCYVGV
jgi:hypothetical protein